MQKGAFNFMKNNEVSLGKVLSVVNTKLDLCVNLFERIENIIISYAIPERSNRRDAYKAIQEDYKKIREEITDYSNRIIGENNGDSKL